MVVGDLVIRVGPLLLPAGDEGVHRPSHDGTGPDDGHLDRQLFQISGLNPGQHLDLGPALHLEDPHRVAGADPVVEHLVVEVDAGEVGGTIHHRLASRSRYASFRDEIHRLLHQGEHPQGQEVDLDEAGVVARVLVPLAQHPPLPGGGLQGNQLHQGAGGDDHAPHVLGDVAGKAGDLLRQLSQSLPEGRLRLLLELREGFQILLQPSRRAVLRQLGELLQVSVGELQSLADLPDRGAEAVGGEGADQAGVLASVLLVDRQDQLLPDVPGEVQVDIRDRAQRLVQEAAQKEVRLHRIDVGETDEVADDGGDGGAPSPSRWQPRMGPGGIASDPGGHLTGQIHDVPVDEEEARQAVVLHQAELLFKTGLGFLAALRCTAALG